MNCSRRGIALSVCSLLSIVALAAAAATQAADKPHLFQSPALSHESIAFGYAGDLWTVARGGGRAVRLTNGIGLESMPIFSPDGRTIAFTGEYDGNTDVFTISAGGGIPHRVTYHPAADVAVGWTPDGKQIVFRSSRESASRYTQLYSVAAAGGIATRLPLPMAYQGQLSPDGTRIAYSPLAPAFGFDFTAFVSWGNYGGGRAGAIWITSLPGLDSIEVPHERASDFSPVYSGRFLYFLSGRAGHIGIFRYDPASKQVNEVLHNEGPDLRSLSGEGNTLVYDQLGEIHLFDTAGGTQRQVSIDVDADLPEVRPTIKNVSAEIDHMSISPTGLRAAMEAHGEILTVPLKPGPIRNITNTTGVMERSPAWSPDGQSIAYFSDESGLYALHVASQFGAAQANGAVKKFPLSPEPAYYFAPKWSPDSKRIAFHDNRLNIYVLDTLSGKLSIINGKDVFGGFSDPSYDVAWSADSKWIAYPRSMANHLHSLFLYSVDSGKSTPLTDPMADSRLPAFDRGGKYLYFTASTNSGASSDGLDMTSDLYQVHSNIYAIVLASNQPSPVAPELEDEKLAQKPSKPHDSDESAPAPATASKHGSRVPAASQTAALAATGAPPAVPAAPAAATRVDLNNIAARTVALPLPAAPYVGLAAGTHGSLYFMVRSEEGRSEGRDATLSRWTLEDRKTEKLADRIEHMELSADGEKLLLAVSNRKLDEPEPSEDPRPTWVIVAANAPVKPGEGVLTLSGLQVRINPSAEWAQMYHEVWRIERAYFYDPHFHGAPTVADERRYEPYVASIASRADLNYIFQDMLTAFSVGHLRGNGGAIPRPRRIAGGLLGADYAIRDDRYCITKIYTGGEWNPRENAPLAQPGLNVTAGDCILAINGTELTAAVDIQQSLEGTAERAISLRIAPANGVPRDITVVPTATEGVLRYTDWIESNRRKVDQLSDGKLAYVYLPNTGAEGFSSFNRYYFSQTQKQGAIIDERFNAGGQVADYMIEVMSRHIEAYWAPRYGSTEHTPNGGIYGPKVMIANEVSGSGGDALPWLFKQAKLGTLVGKRTWGGLVGINEIPVLMDGGHVTSPSVAFFTPQGEWEVENRGVDPDVVVEQDPKAVSEGHDPQLETAVAIALRDLAAHPQTQPARPPYPTYH